MTDYSEEQSGELETLRCIYPEEEFTEVSVDPPCFRIQVQASDSSQHQEVAVNVEVQFSFPPTYPDVPPEMEIVSTSGPLKPEHPQEIEQFLLEQASQNIGMVMVFTLVSELQDKLGDILEGLKKEEEEEVKRKEEELKREEEARFHGTTVTRESFLEWRKKFEEEMDIKLVSSDVSSNQPSSRLTGRQMFERDASLALSDARFLTEGSSISDAVISQDTVEVDESLFQDLEDLQLDDET